MPQNARVFLVASEPIVQKARQELSGSAHEIILTATALDACTQALLLEELPVNVVILDADFISGTQAEEIVAASRKILTKLPIVSWSLSQMYFPWATFRARKNRGSLKMILSVA